MDYLNMSQTITPSIASPWGSASSGNGKAVPTPWLDYATATVPDSHELVLWWAQYLWMQDGNFRSAMERVAAYFLTVVEFPDLDPSEESEWRDFFSSKFDYRANLVDCAHDYLCFHGDTKAVTRAGVFSLRDLEGKTVDVLSEGGVYRPAEFKRFGRQELLEVTFSDGRKVLATPEHQWIVAKSTGGTAKVPTTALVGRRIPRVVAPRPAQGEEFHEGVRHGFVFGDGSLYNKHRKTTLSVANFYGTKSDMLPYFAGHGSPPLPCYLTESSESPELFKIHGLPAHYKALPEHDESAEYWYGFICGFLAADGCVDARDGCVVLTQIDREVLAAIAEQLPRVGMVAGKLRSHDFSSDLPEHNGKRQHHEGTMWYLNLLKQFVRPEDLLRPHHRANFLARWTPNPYGQFVGVTSVCETGLVDDVFCCVEPETHSFVIENGTLTGNCYGNLFVGVYLPFRRFAVCPKCHSERPIARVDYTLEFTSRDPYLIWRRKSPCPECGDTRPFKIVDRPDNDLSRVKLNKYAPNEVELAQNRFSLRKDIYWKILEDDRRDIQNGSRIHIDDTPMAVLQAVAVGGKLRFEPDAIMHVAEPVISGIKSRGWGIPRTVANFRTAWLQQLTNKADQAVATDYTLGMRLISPAPTPGGSDPMQTQGMESFVSNIQSMIGDHRKNPTTYHTAPYPVNYQFLGGEGGTLIPPDKLKFRHQEFLNQLGIPLELHQANLSVQAAPIALRLFESYWQAIPSFYNRVLNFVVETLTKTMNLKPTEVKMQKTTVVDDMSYKTLLLQLMGGNQLSPQTALEPLGIDAHSEARKVIKYQDYLSKLQGEQQEREQRRQEMQSLSGAFDPPSMAQQAQQGQAAPGTPQGGAPAGGIPGQGPAQQATSLQQLSDQATEMAQQLVSLPEYERKQQLKMLREGNKQLHQLVTAELETLRNQARSQGAQMLLQPQPGGQGAPAPQ